MEMAQERRELHQRQAWWPLDTTACSLDTSTTSSSSFFGWDPLHLFYFGQGAGGNGCAGESGAHERHELELLVPNNMDPLVSSVSTPVTSLPTVQDAEAMRRELDELLQNLSDSGEAWNSFGVLKVESGISFQDNNHFDLGTISATASTSPEKTLTPTRAEFPSSSSSQGSRDPRASGTTSGAQRQTVGAINRSSKRSAPDEKESSKGTESCKRSRAAAASATVLRPFAVVKPCGADGEVTLTDINDWILTPPARPVRHPVGEFACAPRVSAGNRPAPSGKMVSGFTRLRTAGRGTITVVRTRGYEDE